MSIRTPKPILDKALALHSNPIECSCSGIERLLERITLFCAAKIVFWPSNTDSHERKPSREKANCSNVRASS